MFLRPLPGLHPILSPTPPFVATSYTFLLYVVLCHLNASLCLSKFVLEIFDILTLIIDLIFVVLFKLFYPALMVLFITNTIFRS